MTAGGVQGKILEDATSESGRVVSVKGDFRFLMSTTRMEEIYFPVSHIFPEDNAGVEAMLKEGQDIEFYVINNSIVTPPSSSFGDRRSRGSKSST